MKIAARALWMGVALCCVWGAGRVTFAAEQPSPAQAYKQNFALLVFDDMKHADGREQGEAKFQISMKLRPAKSIPLYFAYTQISFWQIFDDSSSKPFRENNFNPEAFLDFNLSGGPDRFALQTGIEHESNGRGFEFDEAGNRVNKSRSWNRFYVQPKFLVSDELLTSLKLWHRFKESPKKSAADAKGDDNPDIEKFLGHFELRFVWQFGDSANYELLTLMRKGRRDKRGTFQFDLNFKLGGRASEIYLQFHYFTGYGESLIDYDERVKKIGVGLAIGNPLASLMPGDEQPVETN